MGWGEVEEPWWEDGDEVEPYETVAAGQDDLCIDHADRANEWLAPPGSSLPDGDVPGTPPKVPILPVCSEDWGRTEADAQTHATDEHSSDQVRQGSEVTSDVGTGTPSTVNPGKPVVDAPEFGDRIHDMEERPYWIPGAFPTVFQNETGDPHNYIDKKPDFSTWGPHVLRSKGWVAQAHTTFMYWWMNTLQRWNVLSAKKWFVRDNPKACGYTAEDLKNMGVRGLAKQLVGYTSKIPGTRASKAQLRKLILAMVRQIEIETRTTTPGSASLGDVPCLFGTLTSQRYQWDGILKAIVEVENNLTDDRSRHIADHRTLSKSKRRELVNKYPLFVAWYCAVRLELTLKAIVVPVFGASAYVAVFEWSPTGGMVHLHYILWKSGAPRWDLRAEQLQRKAHALRQAGLVASGVAHCKVDDIIDFFGRYVTEWNPNKDAQGVEESKHVAERVNETREHTAAVSVEDMLRLLQKEHQGERHEYYRRLVHTENMHSFHYPDPLGHPNPSQPCAKLLKGTLNMWYCANGYPRDLVPSLDEQAISQDPLRTDLWRCQLCRNCQLMNCHIPAVAFGGQSNTDAQPVPTRRQAEMYCCKYCSKHQKKLGARSALYEIMDDMAQKDANAEEKYGEAFEARKLGQKLPKAFMAEIGEEMCQAEVAHHANKCPEYLCSRAQKHICLYKKALAFAGRDDRRTREDARGEDEAGWAEPETDAIASRPHKPRRVTQQSDLELYERRTVYWFWPSGATPLSPYLPPQATPEAQVARMSLEEFFRFVMFHGGKTPYLTWYDPDGQDPSRMPIVTISPVVKLREGPNFAFAARWALMKWHPWNDRAHFQDMDDTTVKEYFRSWVEPTSEAAGRVPCPWYVREQYEEDNRARLRGIRQKSAATRQSTPKGGAGEDEDPAALDPTDDAETEEGKEAAGVTDTEESTDEESTPEAADDTRILRMLYRGNVDEKNRHEEQRRKSCVVNARHNFYRETRCSSTAQEEQSAMPAGVINVHDDTDDEEAFNGEQKEIAKEMQELRAAQHWVNQEGWDVGSEGIAVCQDGTKLDLRLDWAEVKQKLAQGGAVSHAGPIRVKEEVVLRDYALDGLDPTQRSFAERVLKWAKELVDVYKEIDRTGRPRPLPQLRTWLCGSAGSGKSTTLKTIVQHVRLLFQREDVHATVELTAYTGVAAFNIGFGAKTACSSFQIFPQATWKKELAGEALRKLERQWESVVLLIVDEISFIGRAFLARMHFRLNQGRRRFFSEAGLDPSQFDFGNISMILVGDFGQLDPIDDVSCCDTEMTWLTCPQKIRRLWNHASHGRSLLGLFKEAVILRRIHRSKEDLWWTESCLRLRDFECTLEEDWMHWKTHDLERGHFTKEQKKYFEDKAVWLCARCEDVGCRNGRKLAHMAEEEKKLIHQIHAEHSSKSARKQSSNAFDGLRQVINLVRGCKVVQSDAHAKCRLPLRPGERNAWDTDRHCVRARGCWHFP